MPTTASRLNVVSVFTGAGGLDLAACLTGRIGRLFSTDSNETFLQSAVDNIAVHFPEVDHHHLVIDVRKLSSQMIFDALGTREIDLVIGGPPCDDFTSTGRKKGSKGDKAPLVFEFTRMVGDLRPKGFLFENVPNLRMMCGDIYQSLIQKLESFGYRLNAAVLEASAFGVPSIRKRLFVVGVMRSSDSCEFAFPGPTHGVHDRDLPLFGRGELLLPYVTVGDVLGDLPDISEERARNFFNHTGRTHRAKTVEHLKTIKQGIAVNQSYRYRAPWNGLCRSLTAGLDDSTKSYIHPDYHREMSVREYARIHGFPDTWRFAGNHHNGIKQVANAVPVPLGKAVLVSLMEYLGAIQR